MIKRVVFFAIVTIVTFFTTYFLKNNYIKSNNILIPFSLINVYVLQTISTIVVYVVVELMLKKKPNQIGYVFLFLTMVQFAVLFVVFRENIFSEEPLKKVEKISFITPIFLCLIIEVVFVVKLLNKQVRNNYKK
ncbi:MAG: hypothetical protein KGV59_01990 [Tenacibaculum sp.]|nr:hypothetical protein [Tenacibaculum sp.]